MRKIVKGQSVVIQTRNIIVKLLKRDNSECLHSIKRKILLNKKTARRFFLLALVKCMILRHIRIYNFQNQKCDCQYFGADFHNQKFRLFHEKLV